MSRKEPFTIGDVETILLVKALDEYTMFDENDPEYEYSLAEKIERLDLSTGWMDGDVFNAGLEKMEEMGLLVWKNEKEGYRLTEEDVIITFGKYKGSSFKDIKRDADYVRWMWQAHCDSENKKMYLTEPLLTFVQDFVENYTEDDIDEWEI